MENLLATSRFLQSNENKGPISVSSIPEESEIEAFSTKFFIKMIRLEEIIYSHEINQKSLNELLALYAKCVEHYDLQKDSIKYYFIEKIQSIISNKRTLEFISKGKAKNSSPQPFKEQYKETHELIESSEDEETSSFNEKNSLRTKDIGYRKDRKHLLRNSKKKSNNKVNFTNISNKKIERAKKVSIYLKVQENKGEININQMIALYIDKCEKNDQFLNEEFSSQIAFINERREQKKRLKESRSPEKQSNLPKFFSVDEIRFSNLKREGTVENINKRPASPYKPSRLKTFNFNENE